jgi:hypothetical protein
VTNLHFNYKDVFRAGRLGFSAKKIWVTFLGFLIAFIGYGILSFIAYMAAGVEIGEVWEAFRLVPVFQFGMPWYSYILWLVGIVWWLCLAMLTGVAVSKITYEQLKGDEFYEIKDAVKFALKSGKSAILAPFVLILFMIALIAMGLILALITWIPYFGELFFVVFAIPAFAVGLFIIYLIIVTLVSLVIGPSIVGTTSNDTFDTLFESFSVVNDQPWRFICYEVLLKIVQVLGVAILGFFAAKAIFLVHDVIGLIVPHVKLDNIFFNAAHYVKITLPPFCPEAYYNMFIEYIEWVGMPNLLFPPEYISATNWASAISSFILGIIYYLIVLFVFSFGGAIFWSGNTLIFTVLVKKKDDKNLLEIKEETFEDIKEEKVEEVTEEQKKPKRTRKKKKD